jgi:hypothetical protein
MLMLLVRGEIELPMPHGLPTIGNVVAGDVIIGLTPALLSSVAPSGMAPPDTMPVPILPGEDVDAVPALAPGPQGPDKPIGPELDPYDAIPE